VAKILVTGAAGFLGSHLVDELIKDGNSVFGIDNFCTGNQSNISHLLENKNFKFAEADISLGIPENFLQEYDQIFHLASPASPPRYLALPQETIAVNTTATQILLDHVQQTGGRLLFASTSEIYGDPLEHPQKETYWGNVNPIGPRSVYDEAKRFGETLLSLYSRENWANVAFIRIFNTYGPRLDPEDGRVVSSFLRDSLKGKPLRIFGDGTQTRSFCYVSDLISGIISMMDSNLVGPVNLGNPNEFTLLELAELVGKTTGIIPEVEYLPLPQDDPKMRRPDISLAKAKLNWEPKIQLEEGLELTSKWMKSFLYS
jgi:dTDP-glucose 4,6-dehydratase